MNLSGEMHTGSERSQTSPQNALKVPKMTLSPHVPEKYQIQKLTTQPVELHMSSETTQKASNILRNHLSSVHEMPRPGKTTIAHLLASKNKKMETTTSAR